jgi:hypothetical protein
LPESDLIAAALSISKDSQLDSDPIHLDAPAEAVRAYADLVQTNRANIAGFRLSFRFDIHSNLLDVCDKMQSSSTGKWVTQSLYEWAELKPWDVFVLASKVDDIYLAKRAMRHLGSEASPISDFPTNASTVMCDAALRYLVGLMNSRIVKRPSWPGSDGEWDPAEAEATAREGFTLRDWEDAAENFAPSE